MVESEKLCRVKAKRQRACDRQRLAGPNAGDHVSPGGDTRSSENISSGESGVKSSDTSLSCSTKSNCNRLRQTVNSKKLSHRDKDTLKTDRFIVLY